MHYHNMPIRNTAIFKNVKIDNFHMKKCDIFLIFAQNIDCGYMLELPHLGGLLEPPHLGGFNKYFRAKIRKKEYPVNPYFTIYEPHYEKTGFLYMRKQRGRSAVQLISAFVSATWICNPSSNLIRNFKHKALFVMDLVGKPENQVSHKEPHKSGV